MHPRRLHNRTGHGIHRVLQCAIAKTGTILNVQGIARPLPQPQNRRRQNGEAKALLDLRNFRIDFSVNFRSTVFTLVERLQAKEDRPGVRRIGELQRIQPGKATA
jgi:hypothetical protein